MLGKWHDVLIRGSSRVNDVVAGLEALVVGGVPEEPVVFFEKRQDLFATRGGVAAYDVLDVPAAEKVMTEGSVVAEAPLWIDNCGLQAKANFRIGIDLFDCQKRPAQKSLAQRAV